PTPPLVASGRVGGPQLERLGAKLSRLGREGLFRLVLIHHPPLPSQARQWRGLKGAARLSALLFRPGAELVIHGHNHHNMLTWCASARGRFPIVGAPPAALARSKQDQPLARYNLYHISGPPWSIVLIGRGLAQPDGAIVEIERRRLIA